MRSLIVLGDKKILKALKALLGKEWEVQLQAEEESPKLVCMAKEKEAGRSEAGQGSRPAS